MSKTSLPGPVTPLQPSTRRCPICGKPTAPRHTPFCSPRCTNIDLGRWLKGSYRVETNEPADDETPEQDDHSI